MKQGILSGIGKGLESALKLRDDLGVALAKVYLIERRWTGQNIGDGDAVDKRTQLLPSPRIVDLSLKLHYTAGGSMKQGDLILRDILKSKYSREKLLMATEGNNVEGFYEINGRMFKPVHLEEKQLTWSVHVRPQAGE